ncbi:MAG: tRNA pseudouridine(55) synthase TruB [Oscillospiraceae bacterium]|nr:tRNA pseudouridine(55) synthase TruB [Oscillospiraceae bacterium]
MDNTAINSGILCMDKPAGFTSFDVVAKLRGILGIRKIGHMGTLDPMATGVLVVLIGNAARAADITSFHDKRYRAGFRMGAISDTQDITGNVTETGAPLPDADALRSAVDTFLGDIEQIPPMYSAVQINGKRLYQLAREGKTVERKSRSATIYELITEDYDPVTGEGTVMAYVSKGTYIRTLINDIGEKCGCGAVMTSLRRIYANGFDISQCHSFDELQQIKNGDGDFSKVLLPTDMLFSDLDGITLSEKMTQRYLNGAPVSPEIPEGSEKELFRIYDCDKKFLGIGQFDRETNELRVKKNLR